MMTQKRACGDCQLCCELIEVTPIGKGPDERCRFQCDAGCSIYEDRPDCCRVFLCGWAIGAIDHRYKPSDVGAVLWATQLVSQNHDANLDLFQLNIKPGRRRVGGLRRLMNKLVRCSTRIPVLFVQDGQCELYFDGRFIERWAHGDFVNIQVVNGRVTSGGVLKREDVLDSPEKLADWEQRNEATALIPETGKWAK